MPLWAELLVAAAAPSRKLPESRSRPGRAQQPVDYESPPLRWRPERRAILRAEADALFFHLYGLNRDDTEYVLGTFTVLEKNETRRFGEYRTKRLVLEAYDAMAGAIEGGPVYEIPLQPGPAGGWRG